MLSSIFLKTLRDRRRSLLFWGICFVLIAVLVVSLYPLIESYSAIQDYMELLPEEVMALFTGGIDDVTSPEGYLHSELFFLVFPLLIVVFAISFGSSAVAGEEEQGTLDLLLSNPLPRWRMVLEKFAAMVFSIVLLVLVFWGALAISGHVVDMGLNLSRLAAVCFSAALLGVTFGTVALAVGCARGRRGLSMSAAGALVGYSYLLNAMAPLIDWLEPFQVLSPFYYYIGADPLTNGLNGPHAAVLIGLTAVFVAAAIATFWKRDLAV
ncbi:MAG: ABC transporter permease subunit [Dehalococcoidia bacterium]|nr:ABC transporter permease subunit [Dehalococcoidia bacterium]MBL7165017.1 ABC transporter permease subunit [Dehalococcoidales bacterium]